jgi:antitoxin ParD1/3/4
MEEPMPSSYTLGDHFETMVRDLVKSGRYASASEVIRDALRLLDEREKFRDLKLADLRAAIEDGLSSDLLRGFDPEAIRAEGKTRLAKAKANAA